MTPAPFDSILDHLNRLDQGQTDPSSAGSASTEANQPGPAQSGAPRHVGLLSTRDLQILLEEDTPLRARDFAGIAGDPHLHAHSAERARLSWHALRGAHAPDFVSAVALLAPHWGEHILAGKLRGPLSSPDALQPAHYGLSVTLRAWTSLAAPLLHDGRDPSAALPTLRTWASDVETGRLSPELLRLGLRGGASRRGHHVSLILDAQARRAHLQGGGSAPPLIQALDALW